MSSVITHMKKSVLSLCAILVLSGCGAKVGDTPSRLQLNDSAASTYHYLIFEEAARNKDLITADIAVEQLVKLAPEPAVLDEIATFYLRNNEPEKARDITTEAMDLYPDQFRFAMINMAGCSNNIHRCIELRTR